MIDKRQDEKGSSSLGHKKLDLKSQATLKEKCKELNAVSFQTSQATSNEKAQGTECCLIANVKTIVSIF